MYTPRTEEGEDKSDQKEEKRKKGENVWNVQKPKTYQI